MSDADASVSHALEQWGITFECYHKGLDDPTPDWQVHADRWEIIFRRGKLHFSSTFRTGIGQRTHTKASKWQESRDKGYYGATYFRRPGLILENQKQRKPPVVTAAQVLYCLLLDTQACDQSFNDWCEDFGFDTDSRKALNTYLECQRIGTELRIIFNPAQRAKLQELLQDY